MKGGIRVFDDGRFYTDDNECDADSNTMNRVYWKEGTRSYCYGINQIPPTAPKFIREIAQKLRAIQIRRETPPTKDFPDTTDLALRSAYIGHPQYSPLSDWNPSSPEWDLYRQGALINLPKVLAEYQKKIDNSGPDSPWDAMYDYLKQLQRSVERWKLGRYDWRAIRPSIDALHKMIADVERKKWKAKYSVRKSPSEFEFNKVALSMMSDAQKTEEKQRLGNRYTDDILEAGVLLVGDEGEENRFKVLAAMIRNIPIISKGTKQRQRLLEYKKQQQWGKSFQGFEGRTVYINDGWTDQYKDLVQLANGIPVNTKRRADVVLSKDEFKQMIFSDIIDK